jgi:hypothetical protein
VSPRKESPPAKDDEIAELREEIADLKNHVRVLSDILNEIREELEWVTQNGLPVQERPLPLPPVPILKRMAADPCAADWNERLVIDYGSQADESSESVATAARSAKLPAPSCGIAPSGKLFSAPGDQRQLF